MSSTRNRTIRRLLAALTLLVILSTAGSMAYLHLADASNEPDASLYLTGAFIVAAGGYGLYSYARNGSLKSSKRGAS